MKGGAAAAIQGALSMFVRLFLFRAWGGEEEENQQRTKREEARATPYSILVAGCELAIELVKAHFWPTTAVPRCQARHHAGMPFLCACLRLALVGFAWHLVAEVVGWVVGVSAPAALLLKLFCSKRHKRSY